jgi:ribulose 1,5-bisphosphate carboxylase large subunit-like protein
MKGGKEEVREIDEEMEQRTVKATKHRLAQNWSDMKPVFSVCSGGI